MGRGVAGRQGAETLPSPAQPLTLSRGLCRDHGVDASCQAGKEVLEKEQGILRGKGGAQVRLTGSGAARLPSGPPPPSPLTWSTLSLRGISETRRQHSGPPRWVVGATCSALMVSWGQKGSSGCLLGLGPGFPNPHH